MFTVIQMDNSKHPKLIVKATEKREVIGAARILAMVWSKHGDPVEVIREDDRPEMHSLKVGDSVPNGCSTEGWVNGTLLFSDYANKKEPM